MGKHDDLSARVGVGHDVVVLERDTQPAGDVAEPRRVDRQTSRANLTVHLKRADGASSPANAQHARRTRSSNDACAAMKSTPSQRFARSGHTSRKRGSLATSAQVMPCTYVKTKSRDGG